MCHPVSHWQTKGSDLFIKGQVTSWWCTKTHSPGGKEPNAHSCAEISYAWLKELGKASQLLHRVFGLASSHTTQVWATVLPGWLGREGLLEGGNCTEPGERGMWGWVITKQGLSLYCWIQNTSNEEKKKAFLLIVLVNQAVALTLATVRTNNHFFLSGISSHFSLQSHSDCSCYDRVVSPNYFRFNHQLRFFLKVESNAQVSSQIPGTQFQKTCIF